MKKLTTEFIISEALKYKTRVEFSKKSSGAYQAARARGILDSICMHMPKHMDQSGENSPRSKYSDLELQKKAKLYSNRSAFKKSDPNAYQSALRRGILDKICSHMPKRKDISGKNHPRFKYTLESLREKALKYATRGKFQKLDKNAWQAARKLGILDDICKHMGKPLRRIKTNEEIKEIALRYNSKSDFAQKSPGAYYAARKRNILDEICVHMKNQGGNSNQEIDLFDLIKFNYPKAQKLHDRKIKIHNKPHIKGFDIDIYIPELRKGIEFDGKYWHSISGLKKGREHWPEEDLKNYHEIKDSWFKSKGIELFHIKENDWIENKKECINKCFEFLKGK